MAGQNMLTTVDNPYSPFTHWDEWYAFDHQHGYNTSELLARVIVTSDELSDADQDLAAEQAIDDIVRDNPLGIYRKIAETGEPVPVLAA
jgi:hypothetical protein